MALDVALTIPPNQLYIMPVKLDAAFIKYLQGELSPRTVKQHPAALRILFDWLVTGHVIDVNPAHGVRGPKYVVKKGKTQVLTADEARRLLDSIPIVKPAADDGSASMHLLIDYIRIREYRGR